jgi:hypothetical protein
LIESIKRADLKTSFGVTIVTAEAPSDVVAPLRNHVGAAEDLNEMSRVRKISLTNDSNPTPNCS